MSTQETIVNNTPKRVLMQPSVSRKVEETERELQELLAAQAKGVNVDESLIVVENEKQEDNQHLEKEEAVEPKEKLETKETSSVWEKRYKDLQRFASEKDKKIKILEQENNNLKNTSSPVEGFSKEKVEVWVKKYPEFAQIVKSLAEEIAEKKFGRAEEKFEEIENLKREATIARTESEIIKAHSDYFSIKEDEAFHNWLETMPDEVQSIVYDKIDDAKGVIKILNLYKTVNKKPSDDQEDESDSKLAARAVSKGRSQVEVSTGKKKYLFTESQINNMSDRDYEKNEEAIRQARRDGLIKFDVSR